MHGWFIDINDCCGCGACEQVCPVRCISMITNSDGFYIPKADREICIQCDKCENVCPVLNRRELKTVSKSCFMCRTKDDLLLKNSSSGGVFTHLAEIIIEKGGVVFGAAFDDDWQVRMLGVSDVHNLCLLRGSKYVAANVGNTFSEVKECLKKGRWVLYVGTACQIAGLLRFLSKQYDTLVTVDIMCYGVPSPIVWKNYLNEISKGKRIKNITFRNKDFGWNRYALHIEGESGCFVHEPNDTNIYMRGFLNSLYCRQSCSNCCARSFSCGSDLTIGDYWELEKANPNLFDNQGMSLVVVHTERGMWCADVIMSSMFVQEVEVEAVLQSGMHKTLVYSAASHKYRKYFFEHINKTKSVSLLIEKCLIKRQKSGIKSVIVVLLKKILGKQYFRLRLLWRKR